MVGNVRFGSKADMTSLNRNVRFTPKSGHEFRGVSWTAVSDRGLAE